MLYRQLTVGECEARGEAYSDAYVPDLQGTRDAAMGAAVSAAVQAIAGEAPHLWLEVAIRDQKALKRRDVGMLLSAIVDALAAEEATP